MYDQQEDVLFGRDLRHKPPITVALTEEYGWGGSHGRLAYSIMVRTQTDNISEYAMNTIGIVPQGYVIVNAKDLRYNTETALKVAHNRVAIPVKEFARQRRLTLKEQWELMNPQWVGTFFGFLGEDPYRSRRPTLSRAMAEAMADGCFDEFMRQFWSAVYGRDQAIKRLKKRAYELERQAGAMHDRYMVLKLKVSNIESDMRHGRYKKYHLQGLNVHEHLRETKDKLSDVYWEMSERKTKAKAIRSYLKQIIFEQQLKIL